MQRKEVVVWAELETAEKVFDLCISQKVTENVNNCLLQYQLTVNNNNLIILSHACTTAFTLLHMAHDR